MLLPRQQDSNFPKDEVPGWSPATATESPTSSLLDGEIESQESSPIRNSISSTEDSTPTQTIDISEITTTADEATTTAEEIVVTQTITSSSSTDLPAKTSGPVPTQPSRPTSSLQPSPTSPATEAKPFRMSPFGIAAATLLLAFVVSGLCIMLWYRRRRQAQIKDQKSKKTHPNPSQDSLWPSKPMEKDNSSHMSLRESMMYQSDHRGSRTISSTRTSPIFSARSSRHTSTRSDGFEMQQRQYSPSIVNPYNPHGPGIAMSEFTANDDRDPSPISPLIAANPYHNQYHNPQAHWPNDSNPPPSRSSLHTFSPSPRPQGESPHVTRTAQNWPLWSSGAHGYTQPVDLRDEQASHRHTWQAPGNTGIERLSFESESAQR